MKSILRVGDELDEGRLNEFLLVLDHLKSIAETCRGDGMTNVA